MAQTISKTGQYRDKMREASNLAVSVAVSGNTTLLEIPTYGLEKMFVQFDVATNNLDAFVIQARCSSASTFYTLYSTAGNYTSPSGLLIATSGDLTAVAAAGTGWFMMDVRGLWDVKILASAVTGAATVNIYAGGR